VAFKGVEAALPQLLRSLVTAGISVVWFQEVEADLEQIFLKVTKPGKQHEATHV
jgi:hypothetical protein